MEGWSGFNVNFFIFKRPETTLMLQVSIKLTLQLLLCFNTSGGI